MIVWIREEVAELCLDLYSRAGQADDLADEPARVEIDECMVWVSDGHDCPVFVLKEMIMMERDNVDGMSDGGESDM